jgi:hypothetical protein
MAHVLVVFLHLLATCTALGAILATDLRLLTRLRDPTFRVAPPNGFVARLVSCSLAVLYLTGGVLIAMGLSERADYLQNQKLLAKLAIVALLTLNAFALHLITFPWLSQGRRIKVWSARVCLGVALPLAVSNALWMYAAFLGVARPWNFTMAGSTILELALAITLVAWGAAMSVMHRASLRQSHRRAAVASVSSAPDWTEAAAAQAERHARAAVSKARLRSKVRDAVPAIRSSAPAR